MDLFEDDAAPAPTPERERKRPAPVEAAEGGAKLRTLADRLPGRLHIGTSSWSIPGWQRLAWQRRFRNTSAS